MILTPASLAFIDEQLRIIREAQPILDHWHVYAVEGLAGACSRIADATHRIQSELAYNAIHPRREASRTPASPRVAKTVSIDDL